MSVKKVWVKFGLPYRFNSRYKCWQQKYSDEIINVAADRRKRKKSQSKTLEDKKQNITISN
ncbi:MAG: hypothetical protein AB7S48_01050 [Bacteroidales bacterium]